MLPQWVQTPKRQREGEGVDPGFLFSRPLEAERLIEWLAEQEDPAPGQTNAAWRFASEVDVNGLAWELFSAAEQDVRIQQLYGVPVRS